MTEVNYGLVLIATLAQFVLGALWYSPLIFGRWWMQIMEADKLSNEDLQRMQKEMGPFYALQLFLTFFTTFAFANFMVYASNISIYHTAWWIWIGFMAPLQVSSLIWANTKKKFWLKQIFVMLSMQFVGIMLAATILSM
jgi:hypothetical protein